MFLNKKRFNLFKVIVVLLVLLFCFIPYFRNNNNFKIESTDSNSDSVIKEDLMDDKEDDDNKDVDINDDTGVSSNKEENKDSDKDINDDTGVSSNKEENKDSDEDISNEGSVNDKKITLVDKTYGESCAQAIEYFYEDNEYRYYFSCIKSNSMYVIINGVEYKLVYALKNNIVTIKELESNGYKFLKESKNLYDR